MSRSANIFISIDVPATAAAECRDLLKEQLPAMVENHKGSVRVVEVRGPVREDIYSDAGLYAKTSIVPPRTAMPPVTLEQAANDRVQYPELHSKTESGS